MGTFGTNNIDKSYIYENYFPDTNLCIFYQHSTFGK